MNLNINRERVGLLRDVADGLVEARRTPTGRLEALRRARETRPGTPLSESNWRWQRCGPRLQPLLDAELVAPLDPAPADPGPWTYQLTDAGRDVLDAHTAGAAT